MPTSGLLVWQTNAQELDGMMVRLLLKSDVLPNLLAILLRMKSRDVGDAYRRLSALIDYRWFENAAPVFESAWLQRKTTPAGSPVAEVLVLQRPRLP
jgi:hypothetical protein